MTFIVFWEVILAYKEWRIIDLLMGTLSLSYLTNIGLGGCLVGVVS